MNDYFIITQLYQVHPKVDQMRKTIKKYYAFINFFF